MPTDPRVRAGDHLAGRIGDAAMQAVANLSSSYGLDSSTWSYEDPGLTDTDENDWPVIVVRRSDGTRYAVDVQVFVNHLGPLIDDQQPNPDRVDTLRRRPRTKLAAPLDVDTEQPPCARCGELMIVGWLADVAIAGEPLHWDCDHLARMRTTHPEWFVATAGQLPLIPEEPSHA